MFDFEKLEVYQKAKSLNKLVQQLLRSNRTIDSYLRDQLRRASISMVINIAEGSGKFSLGDKRNFYTISRGSVYECVSLFELLLDDASVDAETFQQFYAEFETVSKMLFGLIQSQR
ncbi:MAG: four helix bundle protein [Candidatus Uhrbacteria bacterium]